MNPRGRFVLVVLLGLLGSAVLGSTTYLLFGRNFDAVLIGFGISIAYLAGVTVFAFKFHLETKMTAPEVHGLSQDSREEATLPEETSGQRGSDVEHEVTAGAVQSVLPIPQEGTPSALTPNDHAVENAVIPQLYGKIGRSSKIAGLGFVALSITFLILSVSWGYTVFQIDSVVAFLAAIFLLFKDPRARVQPGVLDAMVLSSGQTIEELSVPTGTAFGYVPAKSGVEDVVVASMPMSATGLVDGASEGAPRLALTPPGRGLATLFMRENGLTRVTVDALRISLPKTMCEYFGLAESVELDIREDEVNVTLRKPSVICKCAEGHTQEKTDGVIGCNVASFLAVLFCSATGSQVSLERCASDANESTWTVSMSLAPQDRVNP